MARILVAALAIASLASCATSRMPQQGLQERTISLKAGMSDFQALDVMGGPPDTQESTVCGTDTPRPWRCVIWTYRSSGPTDLRLTFQEGPPMTLNDWTY